MDKYMYCLMCKRISHPEHIQWLDNTSLKLFNIFMFLSGEVEHFKNLSFQIFTYNSGN